MSFVLKCTLFFVVTVACVIGYQRLGDDLDSLLSTDD